MRTVEHDIEDIVNTILEYCPELTLFLRARRVPQHHSLSVIELKALDEADLKTYISDHERGGSRVTTSEAISQLYRHTDGIPSRVDVVLKDLEIVSLSELVNTNSDLIGKDEVSSEAPPALSKAVQELERSDDSVLKRSFELLKALTQFPQGEQLIRIKRFNGAYHALGIGD